MRVFGGKGLVSMVVQSYVEEVVHRHMMGLVGNYKGVHHIYHLGTHLGMALDHSILVGVGCHEKVHRIYVLACIVEWSLSMVSWKVLLPKGLIKSSWLSPSLIVLTLMHVLVIASISFNNIRTKLKASGVRTHSN